MRKLLVANFINYELGTSFICVWKNRENFPLLQYDINCVLVLVNNLYNIVNKVFIFIVWESRKANGTKERRHKLAVAMVNNIDIARLPMKNVNHPNSKWFT